VLGLSKYMGWGFVNQGGARAKRNRRWTINAAVATVIGLWIGGVAAISKGGLGTGWQAREWESVYKAIPFLT
jgi:hypothetical protein